MLQPTGRLKLIYDNQFQTFCLYRNYQREQILQMDLFDLLTLHARLVHFIPHLEV
jgi:hypothetical protein